jgi:hypothetical protein
LRWIWEGFLILSASRPAGMAGPLHITFSEINHYCQIYGIDGYRKKIDFADYVKLLDTLWIEDYYEKEKEKKRKEETLNNLKKNK